MGEAGESELERNIQIEKEIMRQTETDGGKSECDRQMGSEREREVCFGEKWPEPGACPCVRLLYTSVGLVLLSRVDARSQPSVRQCYVDPM
jgi:hypothetical protein